MSRPPDTASAVERRLDAAAEDRLGRVPADLATAMWDPDRCPREWLPRLAAVFQVPVFDAGWAEDDQRRAIRDSLVGRRAGGTQAAMEAILVAGGAIYDYREPDGEPWTAEVDILNADATTLPTAQIARALQLWKRAAVKLTVNQVVGGKLDIPVCQGLGVAVVAPFLEGEM